MAESDYFGFELVFKTVEGSIQAKSDVLIAVIHWYLIKNSFRNVGLGDDVRCLVFFLLFFSLYLIICFQKTLSESDEKSELLPEGWNNNPHSYALRYVNNGQLYILHGIDSEGTMIVNLLQVKTLNVSNTTFQIEDTVKALKGSMLSMVPEAAAVLDRVRKELLVPVFKSNKKDGETQTKKEPEKNDRVDVRPSNPLLVGPRFGPVAMGSDPLGVGNVGRGDLDPFGRGGGMIFEPPGGFNPLANLRRPG